MVFHNVLLILNVKMIYNANKNTLISSFINFKFLTILLIPKSTHAFILKYFDHSLGGIISSETPCEKCMKPSQTLAYALALSACSMSAFAPKKLLIRSGILCLPISKIILYHMFSV